MTFFILLGVVILLDVLFFGRMYYLYRKDMKRKKNKN